MKKDLILKLIFTVLELTDIIALLYYIKSELNKTNQTLGELENINQNPDNDNANHFDFRCHAVEKLKGERDRLIEELKNDTKEALQDDSPHLSKALGALAEDLENLSKANKDLEALEVLSKAKKDLDALEALVKAKKDLADYQSEDADYNSETE